MSLVLRLFTTFGQVDLAPEISILKGFSGLDFGSTPMDARRLFGEPEEENELEDELLFSRSTLLHYGKKGFSLFFEEGKDLSGVECRHESTLLFGTNVMKCPEGEVISLLKANGFVLSEREILPGGELCLNFDEAGLAVYYHNKKISAISAFAEPL